MITAAPSPRDPLAELLAVLAEWHVREVLAERAQDRTSRPDNRTTQREAQTDGA